MRRLTEFLLRLKSGDLEGVDLIPTFAAEYNNWVILGLAALFLALVALTVFSYLREGQHPRRVKLMLAGIRIAIIFCLFALLFQPGVILRYRKDMYSTVAVAVDDSLSMSLKDRYADPQLRRAVSGELSVNPEQLKEISRSEILRRLLGRAEGPLAKLAKDHRLTLLQFSSADPGREAYTKVMLDLPVATDAEQRELAGVKIATAMEKDLTAGGYETNLSAILRDAADRLQGRRVSAIIVVSDGQITSRGADSANRLGAAVAYVRQRNIPIVALAVGDPEPPQNVRMLRLQGPTEVRKGSDVELTAYLAHRNCAGETIDVSLFRRRRDAKDKQWTDTGKTRSVKLKPPAKPGQSSSQEVVLRHQADELGEYEYKVSAKPLDQEFSGDDNIALTKVRVTDQKLKILLVSGDGGWEYQFLRNFLLTSVDRYALSTWQQNADKAFNQESSSKEMKLETLLRKREPGARGGVEVDRKRLFEYEVVMLYDPSYTKDGFDDQFADALEDYVSNHHGGLCYIASNKYSERNLTYRRPSDVSLENRDRVRDPFGPVSALLPVVLETQGLTIAERIQRGEPTPWRVLPTAVGLDHAALRLGDGPADTARVWEVLPGIYWSHPLVKLKSLASALAVSTDPLRRTSDGLGEPAPVIAVQYYGKGRSLYLGSDETWRWRALDNGMYYRRFWSNVVDFLASGRLQKKRVIITTGADRFAVGDTMRVRVEAYDRDFRPLREETVKIDMIDRKTGKAQTLTLRPDAKKKADDDSGGDRQAKARGQYEAMVKLKEIGVFELTALRGRPDQAEAVAGKVITVTLPQEEFRHPEADESTMQTVARDGTFLRVHEAAKLAEIVPAGKLTVFRDVPKDLWDVPLTLALLVMLLGVEWLLRKKYNMA